MFRHRGSLCVGPSVSSYRLIGVHKTGFDSFACHFVQRTQVKIYAPDCWQRLRFITLLDPGHFSPTAIVIEAATNTGSRYRHEGIHAIMILFRANEYLHLLQVSAQPVAASRRTTLVARSG